MEIINFHTHTYRCHHASGTVEEYLKSAADAGIKVIGISDHAPEPLDSTNCRMPMAELDDYIGEVRSAAEKFPQLDVLLGAEVERFPHFDSFESVREIYVEEHKFDYLIGAVHPGVYYWEDADTDEGLLEIYRRMVKENIQMIESGLFVCMAHPDIFGAIAGNWQKEYSSLARKLITAACDCKVFLEFNTYGMRKPLRNGRWQYPLLPFWELASEMKAPTVIGIDAHRPQDVAAKWLEAEQLLAELGIFPENDKMYKLIRNR